jgi:hypothetical protein
MDGDALDNLTDEILEKELGMKLYAHRAKFLKILETLKAKINSLGSKNEYFIIFDHDYYLLETNNR